MNKRDIKMNKLVYLGLLILDLNKILMYEYWYDYTKPKYGNKAKICYKDAESFIFHIKSMKTSMQVSLEILGKV